MKDNTILKLKPVTVFLVALITISLVRTAWMTDDAYITLRTVDNFVNGHGLTWNTDERVQTYTHPLWLFLITIFYFITHEGFYTTIGVSIATSLLAFIVVSKTTPKHTLATYAGLSILFFSKAYIDYSTSGLENPASHLLIAYYLYLLLKDDFEITNKNILQLSVIASLATLNRMDTILFFIPSMLFLLYKSKSLKNIRLIVFGFLPFLIWEVFSIIYYGFPFPNTAYAKLNTGISLNNTLEMGYLYYINSIHWDPITLFTISIAVTLAIYQGNAHERSIAVGIIGYLFYILWIGGDFMSGRFFTSALVPSVILFNRQFKNISLSGSIPVFVFVLILGFISPTPTLTSVDDASFPVRDGMSQISDERSYYFQASNLLYDKRNFPEPYFDRVFRGLAWRDGYKKIYKADAVGFIGYYAGPEIHIIDPLALADPFLSHLLPINTENSKPGHYVRLIPPGYFESAKKNINMIEDKSLAEFYDKIRIITRDPIWTWERFITIWKMNTGQYDYLIQDYNSTMQ